MKTYLFILIIGQSATAISVNTPQQCLELQQYTKEQAKLRDIKNLQLGCFEELGGRKQEI